MHIKSMKRKVSIFCKLKENFKKTERNKHITEIISLCLT